jgi:alkyldihydroxyacetonephosphate synthase
MSISSLRKIVGAEAISESEVNKVLYSRDMMTRGAIQLRQGDIPCRPQAVVWPKSTQEVAQILKWAVRTKTPIIPYGGGSGVSGGVIPLHGGITVDMKKMDTVESVDPKTHTAVVQTGIIGQHLEEALNRQGWTMGHFPSSLMSATLGGYIAARSAGQLSSRYGKIEDMVEALEVVLPSGRVISLGGKVPAYPRLDPRGIFVGSEGTLGVVTRARIKVVPYPEHAVYRGISFNRLDDAMHTMRRIMQSGLRPSVIRLYDPLDSLLLQWGNSKEKQSQFSVSNLVTKLFFPSFLYKKISHKTFQQILQRPFLADQVIQRLPIEALLILGFEGDEDVIEEEMNVAKHLCKEVISRDLGEEPGLHWLKHRYSVSFKMPALLADGNFVDTIEVATTWEKLPNLYHSVHKAIGSDALVLAHFSHAYHEGCSIYFTVVGREPKKDKELKRYDRVWDHAMQTCLKNGATISHHHGIGLLKGKYLPKELGDLFALFQDLKDKLDPHNIMNPGKMGLKS